MARKKAESGREFLQPESKGNEQICLTPQLESASLFALRREAAGTTVFEARTVKTMTSFVIKTVVAALAGLVMLETGCSRSPALSRDAAAHLAAKLANEECDRLYQQRPFSASLHLAVLQDGKYEWGGFDAAAPGGFFAFVRFRADGGGPHVEVLFLCDPPSRMTQPQFPSHPDGILLYPR